MPAFEPSPWIISDLIDRGWSTIPDFLAPATVVSLAAEARDLWQQGLFHPASVGRGLDETRRTEMRSDHVLWLDEPSPSAAQREYFSHMESMRRQIEGRLYLGMASLEAHLALYPVGACYGRHIDTLMGIPSRILSTILYLNQDWLESNGGGLRLYVSGPEGETTHDVAPVAGTLALFLSDEVEHEVLPSTRERLSITGWMLRRQG